MLAVIDKQTKKIIDLRSKYWPNKTHNIMLLFIFLISILGVSSDCTQEQIRKHYKKIAVLVHPDKNKQPGAEEAFKILQRAFELIGEPVNIYCNNCCIFFAMVF